LHFAVLVDKLSASSMTIPRKPFFEERRKAVNSNRFNIFVAFGFALLWVPGLVHPQSTNYAAEVLTKGAGARPLAMGGAFAASANDATAAYWNPAGLALIDDIEITTMHAAENDLQSYDFVNLAFNTKSAGSYAISYMRLGVDGIQITGNDATVLGTATYADQAGFFSGGWKLGKQFALGATLKLLKTDAYTASAFGIGGDLGLLFKPVKELTFGLTARDFTGGSYIMWQGTPTNPTQVLQPSLTLGVAYSQEIGKSKNQGDARVPVSTITAEFDADTLYAGESLNNYHFGLEYWYRQFVAIRGGFETKGFQFDNDSFTPSVGVGLWAYLFEVDYAYVSNSIGGIHYISLITRL
jgi:hypothetical protein